MVALAKTGIYAFAIKPQIKIIRRKINVMVSKYIFVRVDNEEIIKLL